MTYKKYAKIAKASIADAAATFQSFIVTIFFVYSSWHLMDLINF